MALSCQFNNKQTLFFSKRVCDSLYLERYLISSGGAHAADSYVDYITDSLTFRAQIGYLSDDQAIFYDCSSDTLTAQKTSITDRVGKPDWTQKKLSIILLRSKNKFEE